MLDEPKVGHLDSIADQKQVARLDVKMLEIVLLVHVVQGFGGVAQVAEKVVARDANESGGLVFDKQIMQALIREFGDDEQLAADILNLLDGKHKGMAHPFDPLQRATLLLGAGGVRIHGVEIAVDELDGFEETARRLAFPDFAEAACAQRLNEAVAGKRLRIRFPHQAHVTTLPDRLNGARRGNTSRHSKGGWPWNEPDGGKSSCVFLQKFHLADRRPPRTAAVPP